MSFDQLRQMNGRVCSCGKVHRHTVSAVRSGKGALNELPSLLLARGIKKPFLVCDQTTLRVAGERVRDVLTKAGLICALYALPLDKPLPDETSAGSLMMHFDVSCDGIVGIGSGVVNDLCKLLASVTGRDYAVVGTAPSMDGYASDTSAMLRDGLKVSLNTHCPDVIIGDTDILKTAPDVMLQAGLGDMIAKYIGLAEWKISNVINGESYCPEIASLVKSALDACVNNADGLLKRDDEAVKAVFDGLVISGVAMTYAGSSRPASGVEHYVSHLWDMRGEGLGKPRALHGIQCALGTLETLRRYELLRERTPDREKAFAYARAFDFDALSEQLRQTVGRGAESMIEAEKTDRKYDPEKHAARFERIVEKWDEILKIMKEDLPSYAETEALLRRVGAPLTPVDAGLEDNMAEIFPLTKDVRNKYILTSLLWDLGLLDEIRP